MKGLGCSTILYGGFSLTQALEGIARAGYRAIELCARPGMAPHLEIGKPASYYERIKAQIASYGLAIESIAGTSGIGMDTPEFDAVIEACTTSWHTYCGAVDSVSETAVCNVKRET